MALPGITDVLGSIASGGLLGVIGSISSAALGYFSDRAAHKEKLAELTVTNAHELEMTKLQGDAAQNAATNANLLATIQGSFDGLKAAIADQQTLSAKTGVVITDILALFRPGLTLALMFLAIGFVLMKQTILADKSVELVAMAVAWWFGDRQRNKKSENA